MFLIYAPLCLLQLHSHCLLVAPLLLYGLRLVSPSCCSALLSSFLHYVISSLWAPKLWCVGFTLQGWKGTQASLGHKPRQALNRTRTTNMTPSEGIRCSPSVNLLSTTLENIRMLPHVPTVKTPFKMTLAGDIWWCRHSSACSYTYCHHEYLLNC